KRVVASDADRPQCLSPAGSPDWAAKARNHEVFLYDSCRVFRVFAAASGMGDLRVETSTPQVYPTPVELRCRARRAGRHARDAGLLAVAEKRRADPRIREVAARTASVIVSPADRASGSVGDGRAGAA